MPTLMRLPSATLPALVAAAVSITACAPPTGPASEQGQSPDSGQPTYVKAYSVDGRTFRQRAMAPIPGGGAYKVGTLTSTETGVAVQTLVVMKVDHNGDVIGARKYLGENIPGALSSIVGAVEATDGTIWVAGYSRDGATLLLLDAEGRRIGRTTYGTPTQRIVLGAIAATPGGGCVLAGSSRTELSTGTHGDLWLTSVSGLGHIDWQVTDAPDKGRWETVSSVVVDANGEVTVAGSQSDGSGRAWIARFSAAGVPLFSQRFDDGELTAVVSIPRTSSSTADHPGVVGVGHRELVTAVETLPGRRDPTGTVVTEHQELMHRYRVPIIAYAEWDGQELDVEQDAVVDFGGPTLEGLDVALSSVDSTSDANAIVAAGYTLAVPSQCAELGLAGCWRHEGIAVLLERTDGDFLPTRTVTAPALGLEGHVFRKVARSPAGPWLLLADGLDVPTKLVRLDPATLTETSRSDVVAHAFAPTADGGVLTWTTGELVRRDPTDSERWRIGFASSSTLEMGRFHAARLQRGGVMVVASLLTGTLVLTYDEDMTLMTASELRNLAVEGLQPLDQDGDGQLGDAVLVIGKVGTHQQAVCLDADGAPRASSAAGWEGQSAVHLPFVFPSGPSSAGGGRILIPTRTKLAWMDLTGARTEDWSVANDDLAVATPDGGAWIVSGVANSPDGAAHGVRLARYDRGGRVETVRRWGFEAEPGTSEFTAPSLRFLSGGGRTDGGLLLAGDVLHPEILEQECGGPSRCGDLAVMSFDPRGGLSWSVSYGAARWESLRPLGYQPGDGLPPAPPLGTADNGVLVGAHSDSYVTPHESLLDLRLDANGDVTPDCVAKRSVTMNLVELSPGLVEDAFVSSPFTPSGLPAAFEVVPRSNLSDPVTVVTARSCFDMSHAPRVLVAIEGPGAVKSTPPGIDCPGDCEQAWPTGSDVTLIATPAEGHHLAAWTGTCASYGAAPQIAVTLSQTHTCAAQFAPGAAPPGCDSDDDCAAGCAPECGTCTIATRTCVCCDPFSQDVVLWGDSGAVDAGGHDASFADIMVGADSGDAADAPDPVDAEKPIDTADVSDVTDEADGGEPADTTDTVLDGVGPADGTNTDDADATTPACYPFAPSTQTFSGDEASTRYEALAQTPKGEDRLVIQTYGEPLPTGVSQDVGVDPFDLNPATCDLCISFHQGCTGTSCERTWFAKGGVLTVTAMDLESDTFEGTLDGAVFTETEGDPPVVVLFGDETCFDNLTLGVTSCTPACAAGTCVSDGCGGTCGCQTGETCVAGVCQPCAPACEGACEVPDGCGGICTCVGLETCNPLAGVCEPCAPACVPGNCSADQCGGMCGCEAGLACDTATSTCVVPPGAPQGLVATPGAESVTLTWPPHPGATSYTLHLGFSPGVTPGAAGVIAGASSPQTVFGLAAGLPVWFVLTATGPAGETLPSAEVTATPTSLDDVGPVTLFVDPVPDAVGVDPGVPIRVGFSEPVHPATLGGVALTGPGGEVPGALTLSGRKVIFTPAAPLDPATLYSVTVSTEITDSVGNPLIAPRSTGFTTRPAAPTGLVITPGSYAASLAWNEVPGSQGYGIYRSDSVDGPFTMIDGSPRPAFTDRTVADGAPLHYAVTVFTETGESGLSAVVSGTPDSTLPPTPTGVKATPGNGEVLVSWASDPTATYTVYRAMAPTAPLAPVAAGIGVASWRDTGLPNDVRVTYAVQASVGSEAGALSAEVDAFPRGDLPPPPAGLSATVGSGWVELTWAPVPGATRFVVLGTSDHPDFEGDGLLVAPTIRAVVDEPPAVLDLPDGQVHWLSVASVAGDLTGAASIPLPAAPSETLPPRQTQLLRAYPTAHGTVHLDWTRSLGATDYVIHRTGECGAADVQVYGTSHDDTSLPPGTCTYTVEPTSNFGQASAGPSNALSVSATEGPVLVPAGVQAHPGNGSITITWAPTPGMSSVEVRAADSPGGPAETVWSSGEWFDTIATVPGVTNGQTRHYVVRTYSGTDGYSDDSLALPATPDAARPITPAVATHGGDGQIVVSWDSAGEGASYTVLRRGPGTLWEERTVTDRLTLSDPVPNDTPLWYAVQAEVDGVRGAIGKSAQAMASAAHPPAPLNLTATAGLGQVTLSWGVVPSTLSYEVLRADTPGGSFGVVATIPGATNTVHTEDAPLDGSSRTYVVRAWDGVLTSGHSEEVTVAPDAAAPGTTVATVQAADGLVVLSWPPALGAETYRVLRRTDVLPWELFAETAALTWTDETAPNGAAVHYGVQAAQGVMPGALGVTTVAALPTAAAPDPPLVTAIPGNGCASLLWGVVPGATFYRTLHAPAAGGPFTQAAEHGGTYDTLHTGCGLPSEQAHFAVESWISTGAYSGFTSAVAVTPDPALPATPSPTLQALFEQALVSWAPLSPGSLTHIWRRTDRAPWAEIGSTTGSSFSDASVTNGKAWYYAVQSEAGGVRGAIAKVAFPALPSAASIEPPGNVVARPGNGCVTLTWDMVAGATWYEVARSNVPGGPYVVAWSTDLGNDTMGAVCDLPEDTHHFVVRSWSQEAGYSPDSLEVIGVPSAAVPERPTWVEATAGAPGAVSLTWEPVPGAAGYRVYRLAPGASWVVAAQTVAPLLTDSGLAAGSSLHYAVAAFSAAGVGAATTAAVTVP